jgi:DNA repair photolyase
LNTQIGDSERRQYDTQVLVDIAGMADQHACAYCYARPGHQYLGFGAGTDFDSKIVVKTNAAERLRVDLARGHWRGEWISFSGVTDCYQPLEAAYGLTRSCLEACREFRAEVGVITKSALVRRDAELLASFAEVCGRPAQVFLSIPFADDATARLIEPAVTSVSKRFETLRALSDAGVTTGVAIAPLIPGLNDAHVPEILERARAAGATRAFSILLRLTREVRPIFEERLRAALPDRAPKVLRALDEARAHQRARGRDGAAFGERMRGAGPRWEAAHDLFELTRRRLGYELPERGSEAEERDPAGELRPQRSDQPARRQRPARAHQGELFER